MEPLMKMLIRSREYMARCMPGQTMAEYALIFASIVVIVWSAYSLMGHHIGSMASGLDSSLTSA
jgi:Flp pilus assembly pilin Flp